MLRKSILVAAMARFEPGSTLQLMVAQLICFTYVLFVVGFAPYKKDEADFTNQARRALAGLPGRWPCPVVRVTPTVPAAATYMHYHGSLQVLLCVVHPASLLSQAANIQIMVSLVVAMALKTRLPAPGDPESVLFGARPPPPAPCCPSIHGRHQSAQPRGCVLEGDDEYGAHALSVDACVLRLVGRALQMPCCPAPPSS